MRIKLIKDYKELKAGNRRVNKLGKAQKRFLVDHNYAIILNENKVQRNDSDSADSGEENNAEPNS